MTDTDPAGYGALIRKRRVALGLTQGELADAVVSITGGTRLSTQAISNWEHQKNPPGIDFAQALDRVLDADGEILLALGFAPIENDWRREMEDRLARIERQLDALAPEPAVQPARGRVHRMPDVEHRQAADTGVGEIGPDAGKPSPRTEQDPE